jgi:hypothetical protein
MDELRKFKKGGNDLANILERVMEDQDLEGSDVLQIFSELLLERHWNVISKELQANVERLAEISTWDEVEEMVLENVDKETATIDVVELLKKRHWYGCQEAKDFVSDLMCDFRTTMLPRK